MFNEQPLLQNLATKTLSKNGELRMKNLREKKETQDKHNSDALLD